MNPTQLPIFKELMPYSGRIDQNNRWIKLAALVPWDEMNGLYLTYFDEKRQGVIKSNRLMLGLLLGQMLLALDDRGIVEYFHENPYFQYFCGQETFVVKMDQAIIHHSLLSKRRKRLGKAYMVRFEQAVLALLKQHGVIKGHKLMLDATVFPSHMAYPNDVKLLNTVREWCCEIILKLKNKLDPKQKIRTHRKMGRRLYLRYQKIKRKTRQFISKNKKKMLRFVRRNIGQLELILAEYQRRAAAQKDRVIRLSEGMLSRIQTYLETAKQIYEQQLFMAKTRGRHIANRIVSLHQPQVRPIVRGKDGKAVEFGPKAHIALVDGYAFLDDCAFDAYNEGIRLPKSAAKHVRRFGCKPEVVIADQLYGTHANRRFLKKHRIADAFKAIGRPPETTDETYRNDRKKRHAYQRKRNQIEGFFGTIKETIRLDKIVWKGADGADMQIRLGLCAMNLKKAMITV